MADTEMYTDNRFNIILKQIELWKVFTDFITGPFSHVFGPGVNCLYKFSKLVDQSSTLSWLLHYMVCRYNVIAHRSEGA